MVATLTAMEPVTAERRITADELCQLYGSDVCRFAALMSRSPSDAEDLAQDALLRAIHSLRRFDPARGSMRGWLWRIVANAARDAASRRQRWGDLVVRAGLLAPRESETVEDAVLAHIRDADLRATLMKLPLRD